MNGFCNLEIFRIDIDNNNDLDDYSINSFGEIFGKLGKLREIQYFHTRFCFECTWI